MLRWLDRPPEDFLTGVSLAVGDARLPDAGPDQRLRWDLHRLHGALTNLRTARQADMELVMCATQWLGRPATTFVVADG